MIEVAVSLLIGATFLLVLVGLGKVAVALNAGFLVPVIFSAVWWICAGVNFSLLICLPPVLFFLLVYSKVFHCWDFPWSEWGSMWLLRWMTLGAITNALIYGLASMLFFVTWWRNRLRVSEQKRPRLALTYIFTPLFYGFAVAWGMTSLKGLPRDAFAYLALSIFLLMAFGNTLLRISERNKALHSAV